MKRGMLFLLAAVAVVVAYQWATSEPVDPEQRRQTMRDRYYSEPAIRPSGVALGREPCREHNVDKRPLFGDLHVHTAHSTDAYAFDTRVTPAEAYRYARGGAVLLPPLNASGQGTRLLRNERPLDFMAVTDHAEYMGEGSLCLDPEQEAYGTLVCRVYRGDITPPVSEVMQPLIRMLAFIIYGKERPSSVCNDDGSACIERSETVWRDIQQAAEMAYDRSSDCRFTRLVGY